MTGDSDAIVYALRGVQYDATEVQYRHGVLLAELESPRAASIVAATVQMHHTIETFESAVRRLQMVAAELDCEPSDRRIASLGDIGACRNIVELLEFAVDVEPDAELFGAAPNPDLIDDRPPSVRAGIRREDDRQ